MKTLIVIFFIVYLALLVFSIYLSRKKTGKYNFESFYLGGSNLKYFLGFMTFSATLFSTFTLMGMPNMFRIHGVGAWIFLGVTDTAMALVILWFGYYLRKYISRKGFRSVSNILTDSYQSNLVKYIYFLGIFIFLTPYVAIQIKGIAEFMNSAFNLNMALWIWAFTILIIILIYSYFGGLRAIMYSDAIQGLILLVVIWIIMFVCINKIGGFSKSFELVKISNPDLLTVPGPKSLFTPQFLFSSFIAIILMPISQPQLFIRIAIMKDNRHMKLMAIAVGIFAFLIIFPTIFIGMYGAIYYSQESMAQFLSNTLLKDQISFIGALAVLGLVAAAMSTADSQLFALESESLTLLNKVKKKKGINRLAIIFFALISFTLAVFSTEELALLARVSFVGTSLLAPMIIIGITKQNRKLGLSLPLFTGISLIIYLCSFWVEFIPSFFFEIRLELFLLIVNFIVAISIYVKRRYY